MRVWGLGEREAAHEVRQLVRLVGLDGDQLRLVELKHEGPDVHDALAEVRLGEEHPVLELLPHALVAGVLSILTGKRNHDQRRLCECLRGPS